MQATLAELAALVGGQIVGDGQLVIRGAATLRDAEPGQITLVDQAEKNQRLENCRAAAVVAPRSFAPENLPAIQVDDVHRAFAAIVRHFCPPRADAAHRRQPAGRRQPDRRDRPRTSISIPSPPSATT